MLCKNDDVIFYIQDIDIFMERSILKAKQKKMYKNISGSLFIELFKQFKFASVLTLCTNLI